MNTAYNSIDSAVRDADRLLRTLKRNGTPQVRSIEEKNLAKATALAWFKNYRPAIVAVVDSHLFTEVDELFRDLLSAGDRSSSRATYLGILKSLKKALLDTRNHTIITSKEKVRQTSDSPTDFSLLVADDRMREILSNRWHECTKCVSHDIPLAATVMMGGVLEALLLARVNKETNKARIFRSAGAPKSKKDGKVLPLNEWTLRDYLDVSHELGWISKSAKDVGEVLRDYRNYVHPYKELSHGTRIDKHDAGLFWEITKGILRQLIEKTK